MNGQRLIRTMLALTVVLGLGLPTPSRAATTFVVGSTGDERDAVTADGICLTAATTCTLRAAIEQANALAGADTIKFALAGGPPYSIQPATDLPVITTSLMIDGTSQSGYTGTPLIELSGSLSTGSHVGLWILGGTNLIRGMVLNSWSNCAILMDGGETTVESSYIGLNAAGTARAPNGFAGIRVRTPGSTIGGLTEASRNVISGNDGPGITIAPGPGGIPTTVTGNYIGINPAGDTAIPNLGAGVSLGGDNITIGGTVPGARNVISGNAGTGIGVWPGNNIVIQGNYVGLDATGAAEIGNDHMGVQLAGVGATLGGTSPEAGNVISANGSVGVYVNGSGNSIQNNLIGTDGAGAMAFGNTGAGVQITFGSDNTVGSDSPGAGNTIAHNGDGGVVIFLGLRGFLWVL